MWYYNWSLALGPITSNSQKEITLITSQGFYVNITFSVLTDCVPPFIPVKRIYYMITLLDYYTGECLGSYIVLVLPSELFSCVTICSRMQYVIRFAINEELIDTV